MMEQIDGAIGQLLCGYSSTTQTKLSFIELPRENCKKMDDTAHHQTQRRAFEATQAYYVVLHGE
jgi:hypothetical protein